VLWYWAQIGRFNTDHMCVCVCVCVCVYNIKNLNLYSL